MGRCTSTTTASSLTLTASLWSVESQPEEKRTGSERCVTALPWCALEEPITLVLHELHPCYSLLYRLSPADATRAARLKRMSKTRLRACPLFYSSISDTYTATLHSCGVCRCLSHLVAELITPRCRLWANIQQVALLAGTAIPFLSLQVDLHPLLACCQPGRPWPSRWRILTYRNPITELQRTYTARLDAV